jgi:tellurite resistance protein TerC
VSENLSLIFFIIVVGFLLTLDLGVFQKRAHFPSMKEALLWSIVWIVLSLLFNLYVWYEYGDVLALEFFTGYIVEKALSVDNIFVFIAILSYFAVPKELHHKVLFWGVLGAIIMRAIFIVIGAALVQQFHWLLYVLGAFLIVTGIKLLKQKETEVHPERNPVIKFFQKLFPVTNEYEGSKFFVLKNGKRSMTPLFLVLIMIESTDLAFATDSIPAIFAITQDTFIIFTSNICAILGLRALYFVLAGFMQKFRFLKIGLSLVLVFIGAKMLIEPWLEISIMISLLIIFFVLLISVLSSFIPERSTTP